MSEVDCWEGVKLGQIFDDVICERPLKHEAMLEQFGGYPSAPDIVLSIIFMMRGVPLAH